MKTLEDDAWLLDIALGLITCSLVSAERDGIAERLERDKAKNT